MVKKEESRDIRKIFEVWVDSELKLEVLVFFHNNPGVIDTVEGLAKRLGKTTDALRNEIADHIELGILKEKKIGDKIVLTYNKNQEDEIRDFVESEVAKKLGIEVRGLES